VHACTSAHGKSPALQVVVRSKTTGKVKRMKKDLHRVLHEEL